MFKTFGHEITSPVTVNFSLILTQTIAGLYQ